MLYFADDVDPLAELAKRANDAAASIEGSGDS